MKSEKRITARILKMNAVKNKLLQRYGYRSYNNIFIDWWKSIHKIELTMGGRNDVYDVEWILDEVKKMKDKSQKNLDQESPYKS